MDGITLFLSSILTTSASLHGAGLVHLKIMEEATTCSAFQKSAKPIVRSAVWSLTPEENKADTREEIENILKSIDEKIGNYRTNEEVTAELGNYVLPHHADLFEDTDDATDGTDIQL